MYKWDSSIFLSATVEKPPKEMETRERENVLCTYASKFSYHCRELIDTSMCNKQLGTPGLGRLVFSSV